MSSRSRIAPFAWGVLVLNLAVVVWGAYVRASGSGAGCGAHWPLCDGEVIPRAPTVEKAIEFTHRASSGLALLSVVALAVLVLRRRPRRHPSRRPAVAALVFMLIEAAVGALLVKLRLVADDPSLTRALFMAVHLVNTFLLLAALALTAERADSADDAPRPRPFSDRLTLGALAALVLAGVSGAVAALGDTLFPARTLGEALAQDLSPTSHLLLRLRVWHPALAVLAAVLTLAAAWRRLLGEVPQRQRLWARAVAILTTAQLALGLANVALLAPVPLQLAHLLVADLIWLALLLTADARALD